MTVKVFLCHHENDARYCDELSNHLRLPERNEEVELWNRRQVKPGQDLRCVVDEKLEQAGFILVLMSADLLACDYCWGVEVSTALQRHRAGRARLVPVIIRACDWTTCFSELRQVERQSYSSIVKATDGLLRLSDFAAFASALASRAAALPARTPSERPGT